LTLHRRPVVLLPAVLILSVLIIQCGSLPHRGSQTARLSETIAKPGANQFERSLHSGYSDLYDLDKVRNFVKYELLRRFAERDGPNSRGDQLLEELGGLEVGRDSIRVSEIFHEGLVDLDVSWGEDSLRTTAEDEITERARQILLYHCFRPETRYPFDALGELIVLHGTCELDSWTEMTMIVTFRNGWVYWLGEDASMDRTVLRVARHRAELTLSSPTAEEKAGVTDHGNPDLGAESPPPMDLAAVTDSKLPEMQQQREVSVFVDYEPLVFTTINCHVVPTSFADGQWNGKLPGATEGPWDWTRLFVDFYINCDQLAAAAGSGPRIADLQITYEILRRREGQLTKATGESLQFRKSLDGVEPGDGITFRMTTLPFFTGADSCLGYHQLNLLITEANRKAVHKLPFQIERRHHDLLVTDLSAGLPAGIPRCPQIATARAGGPLTVVIPVQGLPYSEENGQYVGKVDFYLINNEKPGRGVVRVFDLWVSQFGDTTGATLPDPGETAEAAPPASLIASFSAKESSPNAYLSHTIEIPRKLSDGTSVTRGRYTLGAIVWWDRQQISEATISDLRIE